MDELKLAFEAEIQACTLFEGVQYEIVTANSYGFIGLGVGYGMTSNFSTEKRLNKKRLRICADNNQKDWLEESWFYVGEQDQGIQLLEIPGVYLKII